MKMTRKSRQKLIEAGLLSLIWIVLIASPLLFRNDKVISLDDITGPLRIMIPLFLLFLINRFVLLPTLFFKNRRFAYFICVGIIITLFTMVIYFIPNPREEIFPPKRGGESGLLEPLSPPPGCAIRCRVRP